MKFGLIAEEKRDKIRKIFDERVAKAKSGIKDKKFAWFPTTMDNGRGVWLEYYHYYLTYHEYDNFWLNYFSEHREEIS